MKRFIQVVTLTVAVILLFKLCNMETRGEVTEGTTTIITEQTLPTADSKKVPTKVEVKELTETEIKEEEYYDSLELLALCVEAEAGNQSLEGRRYVVSTILNRVRDEDFPNDITSVITQPYHFSSYWNGSMDRVEPSELTYEAVRLELDEQINTEVMYFTAGRYSHYGTPWKKIGDHYFSKK